MSSNVRQNGGMTTNKRKALAALLEHGTITKAAEVANLSPKTLQRYLSDDVFRSELATREAAMLDESARLLIRGQLTALNVLNDLMKNSKSESVQRMAAATWLDVTGKYRDMKNEARITALENKVTGHYGK